MLTQYTRTRRPVHLACTLLCGSSGLLPVSSRRLVRTVRCPFPVCMSLAQTLPREVPVVMSPPRAPPQTKKSTRSELCVVGWRNNRFASVIRPVLCDVRLSMAPSQPRRTHWLSPAASTKSSCRRSFFDFPSPSPTGSNRFAVTRLLQWLCHACRSPVARGVCRHARLSPVFSPTCRSSNDSYSRRFSRLRPRVKRRLNPRNTRFA